MIGAYATTAATWIQSAGRDEWGEPETPTETPVRVRAEFRTQKVVNFAGQEVLASGHLLVSAKPTADDKYTIDGTTYGIVAIHPAADFGTRFYRVYIA